MLTAKAAWAVGVFSILLAGSGPAAGQTFEVPDGFVSEPAVTSESGDQWRPVLSIVPDDGPFSGLSSIQLRAVTGSVTDPDAWLSDRVALDVVDVTEAERIFESPDSPFSDPAFDTLRDALPFLFQGLEKLSTLPLDFCEGPQTAYNAAGELRELYCVYQAGPFRQYLVFRLQRAGDEWYYTLIRAMNERRLRHLVAIANSFRAAP